MLVTIDGSGGSSVVQANGALLTFNILRAIKAVANAAAGSVPTSNVITTSNTLMSNVVISYNSNTVLSVLGSNTATGTVFATGMAVQTTTGSLANATGTVNNITITGTFSNVTISGQLTFTNTSGGFTITTPTPGLVNGVGLYCSNTLAVTNAPTGYVTGTTYYVINSTGNNAGQLISSTGTAVVTTASTTTNLNTNIGVFNTTANSGPISNGMVLFPTTTPANSVYIVGTTSTANQYTLSTSNITGAPTAAYSITLTAAQTPTVVNTSIVAWTYGTNNMITSVIANTETGGWLLDVNNTVQDYFQISNTGTNALVLDLYNTVTNKVTYPYHKIAVIGSATNTSAAATGNSTVVVSNHFLAYHGAANGQGWSNATSAFAPATVGVTAPTGPSAMVNQRLTYSTASYNWTSTDYIFTLACNSYYMHVISNNCLVSMGMRNTQTWEDNYPDNPPVYSFSVDTRTPTSSVFYPSSLFAYMRTISNTATFNAAARYQTVQTGISTVANVNPVTGQTMSLAAANATLFDINYLRFQTPMGGIFQLNTHQIATAIPLGYGPVYDSTTGTMVPPAYPIVIQNSRPGSYNSGGNVRGLYKSLSGAANTTGFLTISNFFVANATYTIDSDSYTPVLNGANNVTSSTDLFLVRRA